MPQKDLDSSTIAERSTFAKSTLTMFCMRPKEGEAASRLRGAFESYIQRRPTVVMVFHGVFGRSFGKHDFDCDAVRPTVMEGKGNCLASQPCGWVMSEPSFLGGRAKYRPECAYQFGAARLPLF